MSAFYKVIAVCSCLTLAHAVPDRMPAPPIESPEPEDELADDSLPEVAVPDRMPTPPIENPEPEEELAKDVMPNINKNASK